MKGLEKIQKKYDTVLNARAYGTFGSIDCITPQFRDQFIKNLKNNGLSIGPCGYSTIRLRPNLTFSDKHCKIFLDIFENTLNQTK
jgi:4-aminobutyrate aminotransferase / (S)-3-amino-2-methylpropionate transaminase